jgi:hypothetical protein
VDDRVAIVVGVGGADAPGARARGLGQARAAARSDRNAIGQQRRARAARTQRLGVVRAP